MLRLSPFSPFTQVEIFASFRRLANGLEFSFRILDPEAVLEDGPGPAESGVWPRADELWLSTCLEAFWAVPGEARYWELNLSPARRRWNLYGFSDYRVPSPPQASFDYDLAAVSVTSGLITCSLSTSLAPSRLEISLCAVVRTKTGVNYHALVHTSDRPDFHARAGFVLRPD